MNVLAVMCFKSTRLDKNDNIFEKTVYCVILKEKFLIWGLNLTIVAILAIGQFNSIGLVSEVGGREAQ